MSRKNSKTTGPKLELTESVWNNVVELHKQWKKKGFFGKMLIVIGIIAWFHLMVITIFMDMVFGIFTLVVGLAERKHVKKLGKDIKNNNVWDVMFGKHGSSVVANVSRSVAENLGAKLDLIMMDDGLNSFERSELKRYLKLVRNPKTGKKLSEKRMIKYLKEHGSKKSLKQFRAVGTLEEFALAMKEIKKAAKEAKKQQQASS